MRRHKHTNRQFSKNDIFIHVSAALFARLLLLPASTITPRLANAAITSRTPTSVRSAFFVGVVRPGVACGGQKLGCVRAGVDRPVCSASAAMRTQNVPGRRSLSMAPPYR